MIDIPIYARPTVTALMLKGHRPSGAEALDLWVCPRCYGSWALGGDLTRFPVCKPVSISPGTISARQMTISPKIIVGGWM